MKPLLRSLPKLEMVSYILLHVKCRLCSFHRNPKQRPVNEIILQPPFYGTFFQQQNRLCSAFANDYKLETWIINSLLILQSLQQKPSQITTKMHRLKRIKRKTLSSLCFVATSNSSVSYYILSGIDHMFYSNYYVKSSF